MLYGNNFSLDTGLHGLNFQTPTGMSKFYIPEKVNSDGSVTPPSFDDKGLIDSTKLKKGDPITDGMMYELSGGSNLSGFGGLGNNYGKHLYGGALQSFDNYYDYKSLGKGSARYKTFLNPEITEHMHGTRQSTLSKWGNGIFKMGSTVLNTAIGGTVGALYGVGSALYNSDSSKLYDNNFQDFLSDWSIEAKNGFGNYLTREEQNMNFFQRMGTANFWADDFLQGIGYIGGIVAANYLTGGLSRGLSFVPRLAATTNTYLIGLKGVGSLAKSIYISAGSEGASTALYFRNQAMQNYINTMIARHGNVTKEQLAEYMESTRKPANNLFFVGSIVSAASDMYILGKVTGLSKPFSKLGSKISSIFAPTGFNNATVKSLNKAAKKGGTKLLDKTLGLNAEEAFKRSKLATIKNWAIDKGKGMFMEGVVEEGGIAVATDMAWMAMAEMYDLDTFEKVSKDKQGLWSSFIDAVGDRVDKEGGLDEVYMGALLGLVGGSVGRVATGDFRGAVRDLFIGETNQEIRAKQKTFEEWQTLTKDLMDSGKNNEHFQAYANLALKNLSLISSAESMNAEAKKQREEGNMFLADMLESNADFYRWATLADDIFNDDHRLKFESDKLFNQRVDSIDNKVLAEELGVDETEVLARKEEFKKHHRDSMKLVQKAMKYGKYVSELYGYEGVMGEKIAEVVGRSHFMYHTAMNTKTHALDILSSVIPQISNDARTIIDTFVNQDSDFVNRIEVLQREIKRVEDDIKRLDADRLNKNKSVDTNNQEGVDNANHQHENYLERQALLEELAKLESEKQDLVDEFQEVHKNGLTMLNRFEEDKDSVANQMRSGLQGIVSFERLVEIKDIIKGMHNLAHTAMSNPGTHSNGKVIMDAIDAYQNSVDAIQSFNKFFEEVEAGRKGFSFKRMYDKLRYYTLTADNKKALDDAEANIEKANEKKYKSTPEIDAFIEDYVGKDIDVFKEEDPEKYNQMKAILRLSWRNNMSRVDGDIARVVYDKSTYSSEEVIDKDTFKRITENGLLEDGKVKDEFKPVVETISNKIIKGEKLSVREAAISEKYKDFIEGYVNKRKKSVGSITSWQSILDSKRKEIEKKFKNRDDYNTQNNIADDKADSDENLIGYLQDKIVSILSNIMNFASAHVDGNPTSQDGEVLPVTELSRVEELADFVRTLGRLGSKGIALKLKKLQDLRKEKFNAEKKGVAFEKAKQDELNVLETFFRNIDNIVNTRTLSNEVGNDSKEKVNSLLDDILLLNQLMDLRDESAEDFSNPNFNEDILPFENESEDNRNNGKTRHLPSVNNYSKAYVELLEDGNVFISNLSVGGFIKYLFFNVNPIMRNSKGEVISPTSISTEGTYTITLDNGDILPFSINQYGNIVLDQVGQAILENNSNLIFNKFVSKGNNYVVLRVKDDSGRLHEVPSDLTIRVVPNVNVPKSNKVEEPTEDLKEKRVKDGYTYKKYPDGKEVIVTPKGKEISPYNKNGKKNASFEKRYSIIFGEKTENELRKEREELLRNALLSVTPTNARSAAILYFARSGKVSAESISKEVLGNNPRSEWLGKKRNLTHHKWAYLGKGKHPSISGASESMWMEFPHIDQKEIYDEMIDIIHRSNGLAEIQNELIELYLAEYGPHTTDDVSELDYYDIPTESLSDLSEEEQEQFYREWNEQSKDQENVSYNTLTINQEAVNNLKPGDSLRIIYPTSDYNVQNKEENQRITQDQLLVYDSNDNLVGVIKAGLDSDSALFGYDSLLALRKEAIDNKNNNKGVDLGNGLYDTGVRVGVSFVYNGIPNIQLRMDENGKITSEMFPVLNSAYGKNVKPVGFGIFDSSKAVKVTNEKGKTVKKHEVAYTETVSKDFFEDKNFRYVTPFAKNGKRVPYVLLEHYGRVVAYPVELIAEEGFDGRSEMSTLLDDTSISDSDKFQKANELLLKYGVNVSVNSEFAFTSERLKDDNFRNNILDVLQGTQKFITEDDMKSMPKDEVLSRMRINIDLTSDEVFHSAKPSMDLSKYANSNPKGNKTVTKNNKKKGKTTKAKKGSSKNC